MKQMKEWELWLGKPRGGRFVLVVFIFVAVYVLSLLALEKLGVAMPLWAGESVAWVLMGFAALMIGSLSLYGLFGSIILLSPVILIMTFGGREIEKEIWFWFYTTISTVIGAVAYTRYARVRKLYRR